MSAIGAVLDRDVRIPGVDADPITRPRLPLELRDDRLMKVFGHLVCHSIQPAIIEPVAGAPLKDVASDIHGPFFVPNDNTETALILPAYHHEQMMIMRRIGVES